MMDINDRRYLTRLAKQCGRAYSARPDIEADGVEVLIEEDDHENVVVAFRGTTLNGWDILSDLWTIPWYNSTLKAWCHCEFLEGAEAIFHPLVRELYKTGVLHTGKFVLTGHSKGGAEATLVAAAFVAGGYPPAALVTFGAPLAGSTRLTRWLRNVPGHRVVYRNDPVPRVPAFLNKLGVFKHHRGSTTVDSALNSGFISPHNHKICRYIDALGYGAT